MTGTDIAIQWGVLRRLRVEIGARPAIVLTAIVLDVTVLGASLWVKVSADPLTLYVAAAVIALILAAERLFMRSHTRSDGTIDI